MPRKTEDLAFLKNQLRVFISGKRTATWSPTPAVKFRAMLLFASLGGFTDAATIHDLSDPTPPRLYQRGQEEIIPEAPPKEDPRLQAMLNTADKLKGGVNADQLPEGSS